MCYRYPMTIEMYGQRFGRLVVLTRAYNWPGVRWICLCDCGNKIITTGGCLRHGNTKSCGCYRKERGREHGSTIRLRHGHCRNQALSAEYRAWSQMKHRCLNPASKNWSRYGGRGITVCDRWIASFDHFIEDMGPRPEGTHGKRSLYSIDRIDNDRGYEPDNCRWATVFAQNRNTSWQRRIEVDGTSMSIPDACALYGISTPTFYARIRRGMTEQEALATPRLNRNGLPVNTRPPGPDPR